jgi:hypothetical protein
MGFALNAITQLVYEDAGGAYSTEPRRTLLHCERCNAVRTRHDGNVDYFKGRVIREIERLIRTDEWRTHVRNVEAS